MNKEVIQTINDLVTINKNRIVAYKEVLHELKDEAMVDYCRQVIKQSEEHNHELAELLRYDRAELEDKTTTLGVIYNTWMDLVYEKEKEPVEDVYLFRKQTEEMVLNAYDAALKRLSPGTNEYNIVARQREKALPF